MIQAHIVAHSVSPAGIEIASVQYTAHRFVLAEINTHRAFSRSARSSRAVPTRKLIEEVRNAPAMPLGLARNQRGMQGGEALNEDERYCAEATWRCAARDAASHAEVLLNLGLHKQHANRVLEPFLWVHGLITATDWANWDALRMHADAQPEIRELADAIFAARQASEPTLLQPGEWHLPYVTTCEIEELGGRNASISARHDCHGMLRKLSAARCARVSYRPFDGSSSVEAEVERYRKLVTAQPVHASPVEHQAKPDRAIVDTPGSDRVWERPQLHRNFRGWIQARAYVPGETVRDAA